MREIVILPEEALDRSLAQRIVAAVEPAVRQKQRFSIALSGGATPRNLHNLLASEEFNLKIEWEYVFCFLGDERMVPESSNDSNYKMLKETLFNKIPIPSSNVFPVNTSLSPNAAASDYEKRILNFFGDQAPRFDLIILGVGTDGHTASLLPDTPILNEIEKLVGGVELPVPQLSRISFTLRLINEAKEIVFLIKGVEKSEIVQQLLEAENNTSKKYPVQMVDAVSGKLTWYIDEMAASKLKLKNEINVH